MALAAGRGLPDGPAGAKIGGRFGTILVPFMVIQNRR
jgi:hypothetical protein